MKILKKRKLKGFVLPTIYIMVMGVLFLTISFLGTSFKNNIKYDNLSVGTIIKDDTVPVISETEEAPEVIYKPYTSDKVRISKSFYSMQDDESKQQNSLVYYKNTYLQNSGILYSADETFDVYASLGGTVTNVSQDEILGNVVEITYNTNLKLVYYSLSEVEVKKNDALDAGAIIGKSGDNYLEKEKDNCLLFEVYYNGEAIDPEDFYNMNVEDFK